MTAYTMCVCLQSGLMFWGGLDVFACFMPLCFVVNVSKCKRFVMNFRTERATVCQRGKERVNERVQHDCFWAKTKRK